MALRIVATGGTIASLADPATGVVRPAVAAEELAAGVPGLDRHGPVQVEEVARVNGWNVTPATMLELARRVQAAADDPDVAGVVVTHGTDTVEETAFVCDLTVASDLPVAFAAAMRSGDEVGADGPRNLLAAARLATDPAARGLGAVVVLGDEAHAARWVRKQHALRAAAFASPGHAPVALVTPERLRLAGPPPPRHLIPRPATLHRPVPIVAAYAGLEEHLVEAVLDATGAAGLVVEGTGLGNVPGSAVPGLRAARARGLPVVVATRVPAGGTAPVYGGPGGGATLRDLGVLHAGALSAAKARLLLMLLLAAGGETSEVEQRFAAAAAALSAWRTTC
jgi:L-asparaginase